MKMLFRSYLSSLREREELDAILPDLLSELGFLVFSRPARGTAQAGVDVAALGPEVDGKRKFYLFTIKSGDITREVWHDGPQGVRASLESIIDKYIPNRIPHRFRKLDVVVCLVFGGVMREQVREDVDGFFGRNTTERVSFEEWNGDLLATLLMTGVLREDIMPKPVRAHFQKAVALVDEPDIAYQHFARLVHALGGDASTDKERLRAARQMYVALWVLYVWARDIDNLEAPYQCSELVLLRLWELLRRFVDKPSRVGRDLRAVFTHAIQLHMTVASEFLEHKVLPHVQVLHGVSLAVRARTPADVNLKLFDVLGRVALHGLWFGFFAERHDDPRVVEASRSKMREMVEAGLHLIDNNPALRLPLQDIQGIEIALFLRLMASAEVDGDRVHGWLHEMANGIFFAVSTHGRYPCVFNDYRDLIAHPAEASDEYRKEATTGSTLLPLLGAILAALGDREALSRLAELQQGPLQHCTMQVWVPDDSSEDAFYIGGHDHGMAICGLHLSDNGTKLFEALDDGVQQAPAFFRLSAIATGYWPIVLVACRHFRIPVPPQFWLQLLARPAADDGDEVLHDVADD